MTMESINIGDMVNKIQLEIQMEIEKIYTEALNTDSEMRKSFKRTMDHVIKVNETKRKELVQSWVEENISVKNMNSY